jgi:NSS family neurotransmitter:Na+ symporter
VAATTGTREVFATRAGFLLAAAGSAVGLGNMWRFPYQASEGGGAAFVLVSVLLTLLLGIPIMLAEFGIGRRGRRGPIGSLRTLGGRGWGPLGYLFVAVGLLILSYYSVIAGWTVRYGIEAAFRGFTGSPADHFAQVSAGLDAAAFHVAFMVATVLIVVGGVKGGIERASLLLMPMLFVLLLGLAVWAATLDGAATGYVVYLKPDLAEVMNPDVWRAAASQAFFSLSLGMGGMLTFASYLERNQNLPESATIVAFTDFGVAFVAGLLVFPVIYSFGLQDAVSASTIGALFIAVPSAFEAMGALGRVVGLFFFVVLAVGAITSAISLLEVVTASMMDETGMSRRKAALLAGSAITVVGIFPAMDTDALGLLDKLAGELLLLAGGLILAVFAAWLRPAEITDELLAGASPFWQRQVPRILAVLRWVAPPVVAVVLIFSLRETIAAVAAFLAG